MTYSTGSLIQASDYNGFVSSTNAVWNTLYGQSALGTVSTGGTVSATQWATLCNAVTNTAVHQGTTNPGFSTPTTGQTVSVISALATTVSGLSTSPYNAYAVGTRYTGWTGTNYVGLTTQGSTPQSSWTLTFTNTVTFSSVAAANYFFNAGGLIRLDMSKTSTGQPLDTEWNTFISTIGTLYLSSDGASKTIAGSTYTGTTRVGGSGTPTTLATSTGFNQLTSTPAVIFQISATGYNYSSDYVQVSASWNSSTFVLTLTTVWYQQPRLQTTTISGGSATVGSTFGTAPAVLCTYYPPETTYLTNSWGTPTVAATTTQSNPQMVFKAFSTPGMYTYTIPSTLQGSINYVLVGGGGGGAGASADEGGGGGGAGGYIYRTGNLTPGETVTIQVGDGGGLFTNGTDTYMICSLGTIIALGGGGGQALTGYNGGSGGGGSGAGGYHPGGTGLQPSQSGLSAGYGNNGAGAPQVDNYPGGGGGGAGGAGGTGGSNNGGAPVANPISGCAVGYNIAGTYYLAGGGSGRYIGESWITYPSGSGYGGDGAWGYPNKQGGTAGAAGCVILQGYW